MPAGVEQDRSPVHYEINTWPWLEAPGQDQEAAVDLGLVPDRYWDEIADLKA